MSNNNKEKISALKNLSQNSSLNNYFFKYVTTITGNLPAFSIQTVSSIRIDDLEKLLYRSFLEGAYSKELEIKGNLEKVFNE